MLITCVIYNLVVIIIIQMSKIFMRLKVVASYIRLSLGWQDDSHKPSVSCGNPATFVNSDQNLAKWLVLYDYTSLIPFCRAPTGLVLDTDTRTHLHWSKFLGVLSLIWIRLHPISLPKHGPYILESVPTPGVAGTFLEEQE